MIWRKVRCLSAKSLAIQSTFTLSVYNVDVTMTLENAIRLLQFFRWHNFDKVGPNEYIDSKLNMALLILPTS